MWSRDASARLVMCFHYVGTAVCAWLSVFTDSFCSLHAVVTCTTASSISIPQKRLCLGMMQNLMKCRKGSGPRGIPCSDVALILYIVWCRERRGKGLTACCRKVLAESCIAISLSCCVDRRSGTVEGRDNGQSQDSKDTPSLPAHARQWDLQEKPS